MLSKEDLMKAGLRDARKGLYQSATDYFRKVIEKDPSFTDAHFYLAGIYFRRGKISAARNSIGRALHLDPDHKKAGALWSKLNTAKEEPEKGESPLPRLLGYGSLAVLILIFLTGFGLIYSHLELIQVEYGSILSTIYHSMDIEDIITDGLQLWRFVTFFMVTFVVVATLIFPSLAIIYLLSFPFYAIRYNRWPLNQPSGKGPGTLEALLTYGLIAPLPVFMAIILTRLWGPKFLVIVAILILLAINQLWALMEEKKIKD